MHSMPHTAWHFFYLHFYYTICHFTTRKQALVCFIKSKENQVYKITTYWYVKSLHNHKL